MSRSRSDRLIPALLIMLSLVPALAGTARLEAVNKPRGKPKQPKPSEPALPQHDCRKAHEFADALREKAFLELSNYQLSRLSEWVAEQCRADAAESGKGGKGSKAGQLGQSAHFAQGPVSKAEAARHLHVAATQAAYTPLHRLVVLRRLES